jgi:long-chain acyl-CoA synthetase
VNTQPSIQLVRDFLEESARKLPAKIALICGPQRLTYAEVDERANRLANTLVHRGIQRGDRVAICLKNCVEAVVGIFATLKAGGTFVVVNHTTKDDKLAYILNNCGASALLLDGSTAERGLGASLLQNVESLKSLVLCGKKAVNQCKGSAGWLAFDSLLPNHSEAQLPRVNSNTDLACLIYTSGTTGDPKGVMSDHGNVVFAVDSIISYLQNVESDIVINVLPLSFDYGLYQLLMVFRFGGTLVLEQSFTYPATILERIERERVTGFAGVPTIYSMLLPLDLSGYDLSHLRYLTNTAAALPVSHIEKLRDKFPHVTIFSMYGLTETKRTLYLPPAELDRRPGSVGIPIPGTEAWIEDENGKRLGAGETGFLVVRGRHVMRGYWEAPEATAKRFRIDPVSGERVCHTGDLFKQDSEGYFYFVGRSDDIIKSRGEKIAPKEVEAVIYGIQGVQAVAVIGVPDPVLGQAIKAFVVAANGSLTERQVLAHCRANLEDYMIPKIVEFCPDLPQTTTGKIKKTGLI